MSGAPPPPNYSGQYAPPPEKSGYPQQQQQQQYPAPPQQQFSPPPHQGQFSPPPHQQQYGPPPGQTGQQQYYPPPPPQQQQSYGPPPQSPGQFSPPPPMAGYPQGHAKGPGVVQTNSGAPASTVSDTVGEFVGGGYRIDHRDSNTLLTLNLAPNAQITAKPGSMIGMSPTVTLKGQMKVSLKKLLVGGDIAQSTFTGPGEVLIAPPALGDIVPIRLERGQTWSVGKDAFLASTDGVKKDFKSQGLGKAFFSGEGLFVIKVSGEGILFITSLGAIIQKNMGAKDEYIVDNDHLVAWNCKYNIERVASGGILSGMAAAEGVVCRFTGPGTVFIQTRNPTAFGQWIGSHMQGAQ